ncbi:MAG: hypothetical protein A3C47_06205 [Omnitrophica bacterium RIFCSPHIGHO2_02_FULL_51_18]|nr:MAG: hypothetical protein A3C47_06205 [Omnitrophica bacterium RIFCSPHIGHO2_02_FULL_51_18]
MLPIEIESRLEDIKSQIEAAGAELIDISLRRSGGRGTLTLLVDKPGGITLDECALINGRLGTFLDETGFSGRPYILEVNSPGLDRPLKTQKDFLRVVGQRVRVVALDALKKSYVHIGQVLSAQGGVLELKTQKDGQTLRLPLAAVVKAVREIKI